MIDRRKESRNTVDILLAVIDVRNRLGTIPAAQSEALAIVERRHVRQVLVSAARHLVGSTEADPNENFACDWLLDLADKVPL